MKTRKLLILIPMVALVVSPAHAAPQIGDSHSSTAEPSGQTTAVAPSTGSVDYTGAPHAVQPNVVSYFPATPEKNRIHPVPEPTTLFAGLLTLVPFGVNILAIMRRTKRH